MDIKLQAWSNGHHLQQAYAGLSWLARAGVINLRQEMVAPQQYANSGLPAHIRDIHLSCFRMVIDNRRTVVVDLHDSFEFSPGLLQACDVYIKRSLLDSYVSGLETSAKVIPYGPFYEVYSNYYDPFLLARARHVRYEWRRRLRSALRAAPIFDGVTSCPREHKLSNTQLNKSGKVLFSVNLHDPFDDPKRSQQSIEQRLAIVEERVSLIRRLKSELGSNFIGGIKNNKAAQRFAPDCILPDAAMFSKQNYINTLRSVSIGIASTGLHNSVGGKFGEYVACAKGIVCAPMIYNQGAHLQEGQNYLIGATVDAIVDAVARLLTSPAELENMQQANADYYRRYLRPDKKMEWLLSLLA